MNSLYGEIDLEQLMDGAGNGLMTEAGDQTGK